MDHKIVVYKIDNLVQSSLVLTLIQGSIHWSTLRSLSCNSIYTKIDSAILVVFKKMERYREALWELRVLIVRCRENIQHSNRLGYQEKLVVRTVRELWQLSIREVYFLEWLESDELLLFHGKIYILNICNLCQCIISLYHQDN